MDDQKLANKILEDVGGKQNVRSLIHCVTRLRFRLKDKSKAKTDEIKNLDGVMTVVQSGGQYQVVIGDNVTNIFDKITPHLDTAAVEAEQSTESDQPKEKTSFFNSAVQLLSSLFTPILGPLAAAGILKGFLVLLTLTHALTEKSGTYMILYATADALFYFLPVLLGFSAAKVFKTNQYMGAIVGCALVYPTMVAAYNAGTHLTFLGIPVVLMSYAQTLIPIIAAVYFLSVVDKILNRIVPKALKLIFVPLLSLVIVVPVAYLVVGPVTSILSQWLADAVLAIYGVFPALAGFLLAGIWQGAVLLGLHWAFIPIFLNNIATKGFDPINAMLYCTVFGQVGAALAMFIKAKDRKFKELSLTAVISGFLGITEPIIYGVTIPHKKSFVMASIGSAFGGAIAGWAGAKMYGGFATGGVFGIPMFINKSGINSEFIGFVLSLVIAFSVALVLTLITVPSVKAKEPAAEKPKVNIDEDISIDSPVAGTVEALQKVNDEVFSKGLMGPGVAIVPSKGEVVAPFDGTVVSVFPTKHAIGLRSDSGVELLIHIGLDTVELKGTPFDMHVQAQDKIKKGQLLENIDIDAIQKSGYDPTVIVVVTNQKDLGEVNIKEDSGNLEAGTQLLIVTPRAQLALNPINV
ncbi:MULTISPECIES: beta-glucoside-specific PTS transporter subunit IIABC [unclassified Sporolactobacillus]|uniref:beta-glucoside-specific PTS transporter subunit IIABC n=1 Tax=unclassified Sporolactobacillus TaxID=2628533 RepID=UPI002367794B|nr:beta-glucoside-specific PTS transporter subunit IIABC [Sporolactobacillus sp. CQH2019]MDD9149989.1 beta-glucoside-specific PTS transporter subunit IIABC [Sporolactobacillus sp. CQH2019]